MAIINDFMSLIYPRRCEACGELMLKHEAFLCGLCMLNLPRGNYHKSPDNEMQRAFAGRVPCENTYSFFIFEKSGKVQKMLHHIKYEHQQELAFFLGNLFAQELLNDRSEPAFDVIIPIPLHTKKLKSRGFNQSERFAAGLAKALKVEIDTTSFIRTEESSTQTRKRKFQRWENVEGIFKLINEKKLISKHVLLVDDVVTTGATIEAAWNAIKQTPGIKVSVASIAFAARNLN